jgi:hypothetical protein
MKILFRPAVLFVATTLCWTGCATSSPGRPVLEYRLIRGVTDRNGLPEFEKLLNAAAKEGFKIHSTTLIPETPGTREQTLIILERPAR